jgi:hypothetical protein
MQLGKTIKRFGAAIGGCVSGAIAAIGTSINIPLLGGAIMTGAFPVIAALVLGAYVAFGIHSHLKDIDIVRIIPIAFQVEVLG